MILNSKCINNLISFDQECIFFYISETVPGSRKCRKCSNKSWCSAWNLHHFWHPERSASGNMFLFSSFHVSFTPPTSLHLSLLHISNLKHVNSWCLLMQICVKPLLQWPSSTWKLKHKFRSPTHEKFNWSRSVCLGEEMGIKPKLDWFGKVTLLPENQQLLEV